MANETFRKLLQEKFGYTADVDKLAKDSDEPTKGKEPQKSAHPLEKYRNAIKHILGATTTEEDAKLEHSIDFDALIRLANKHGLSAQIIANLNNIKSEFDKPVSKQDEDAILAWWEEIKENIPYWFLGLLSVKEEQSKEHEDAVTSLLDVMAKFNKESEKAGKEFSKNTEHASTDTKARKALEKALKDAGIDLKLIKKDKTDEVVPVEAEPAKLELPEDPSKKDGDEYTEPNKEK